MATVVNNSDSGAGAGGWMMAIVAIVVLALIALFVWPGLRGGAGPSAAPTQVDVSIPTPGSAQ
jgi:hypothetical protein